ncbi:MAG: DNA-processing protein DprA [Clostridia bacterium]|nr:DNA-processing protein DprA [Clostridia bacterium]MBN2882735.1 DNA-processing protein DprA [Clostridia bacterium]
MCNDYLLTLSSLDYISFREKYLLLEYFGSADKIFESSYEELFISRLIKPDKAKRLSLEKVSTAVSNKIKTAGIKTVSIFDEEYPFSLKHIYDPPIVLYYIGQLPKERMIAIVGSRNCSKESAGEAFELSSKLACKGFCIVSGMAKGIDTAAHRGALTYGKTIAVLGSGVDICYPPENLLLKNNIENQGCVLSEYAPGKKPAKYNFPARNRIISGLSEAIIVAEAGEKSGALITVEFALEHGKDVFVLGSKQKIHGIGSINLHEDGAPLITVRDTALLI